MEVIAPLLLAAMVGLVILVVLTARRQRAADRKYFVEAARTANLVYLQEDDGTAEALAQGFDQDEFARFSSPSRGRIPPENVVHGKVVEGEACLFQHSTHRTEGDARQWFVAIVANGVTLNSGGLIKCRSHQIRRVKEIGAMPEVEMWDDPDFSAAFGTQAEDPASARRCLTGQIRRMILDILLPLGFPVDLQIITNQVAVYPAERNYDPAGAQNLVDLLAAARKVAGALAKQARQGSQHD